MNKKLNLLVASIVFSGVAQADSGYPVDLVPVSDNGVDEESLGQPMSCEEARATAWFIRELSRTDGETNPEVAYLSCPAEILARSDHD